MKNKNYQRIDNLIIKAFFELIEVKEANKITVSELCRKADINRTTFYKHYQDVWEITESIQMEFINKIDSVLNKFKWKEFIKEPIYILTEIENIIKENSDTYKFLLTKSDVQYFLFKLTSSVEGKILDSIDLPDEVRKDPSVTIRISYFAGGIANTYRDYLSKEKYPALENISQEISSMIKSDYEGRFKGKEI